MWYVVQTVSGREQTAIEKCQNALGRERTCKVFTPVCQIEKKFQGQWTIQTREAFPGYIFIESNASAEELEEELKPISSIVVPVRIGGGVYPVRPDEEAMLRRMMDENNCICISVGYLVDQKLVIREGPLGGFTEAVKWIDRHKRIAEVELILLDERRKMRVGLEVRDRMTAQEYHEMIGA